MNKALRIGLLQLSSGPDPAVNLRETLALCDQCLELGADLIATPEVTNHISLERAEQERYLVPQSQDKTLRAIRDYAKENKIYFLIGSLALRSEDADHPFVNRSFLIDDEGAIHAQYDKIHMFDVTLETGESYRESSRYARGAKAVIAKTKFGQCGLTICYDVRFPKLFRDLAQAGSEIIFVPSAFSVPTGKAHWHVLLRARAIETGSFIIAPAQWGEHGRGPKTRKTYGHSLVVSPWGKVLYDGGEGRHAQVVSINVKDITRARKQIPSLMSDAPYRLSHV